MIKKVANMSVGNYSGKYVSNTASTTPATGYIFNAIQVITDCELTAAGNITGLTSVSLTAGTVIYGRYTSITLAS